MRKDFAILRKKIQLPSLYFACMKLRHSHVPLANKSFLKNYTTMEGPIEFQPTKANVNYFETTQNLEVLQDVTLIQKRPQLSEG